MMALDTARTACGECLDPMAAAVVVVARRGNGTCRQKQEVCEWNQRCLERCKLQPKGGKILSFRNGM